MMNRTLRLMSLSIVLCLMTMAVASQEKTIKKKVLTFSSVENPRYRKILDAIYAEVNKRAVGFEIKFKYFPAKRSFFELKEGHVDGEFGRYKGVLEKEKGVAHLLQLKEPLVNGELYLYVKKNDKRDFSKIRQLRNMKVVFNRGILLASLLLHKSVRVSVDKDRQVLSMLELGRVDGALLIGFNGFDLLPLPKEVQDKYRRILVLSRAISPLLNKKHQAIVPEFERILKKLHEEKFANKVLAKFTKLPKTLPLKPKK